MAPGKRDVITVQNEMGNNKFQKWHMSMCVKEANASFKQDNPGIKIGVNKFTSLHLQHFLLSSQMPSNVCTSVYHENFVMALSALHTAVPSVLSCYKEFAVSCLVNHEQEFGWFGECKHENVWV